MYWKRKGVFLYCLLNGLLSQAQDNYEIQVYGSETVKHRTTMVELHSNYIFGGTKLVENGVLPTHHILHETIEITHGFTPWLEVGFYLFNAIGSDNRTSYVGSHIRPRVRVPDSWGWPLGASLSMEVGYQKPQYSEDDWNWEIRPIVDKKIGKTYLSFNPTFEKSLHGLNSNKGFIFSPNFKASYDLLKVAAVGMEYYGSVGNLFRFDPYPQQQHQLFAVTDLNISSYWELNLGYGRGLTSVSDQPIIKLIVGYRIKPSSGK